MFKGKGPLPILLVSDTLLALFDSANPSHILVNRELLHFSEQGLEPQYPYPALIALYNATAKSKNIELHRRVNAAVGQVASSPLIVMPTAADVAMGSSLANVAAEKELKISFLDITILAMAYRMDAVFFTNDKQVSALASTLHSETSLNVQRSRI